MKRLNPETLQQMFPAPSEDFAARMEDMLRHGPGKSPRRSLPRLPLRTAAVVLLVLLALSATAFALTRPTVLDWLLGTRGSGSVELHNIAQAVHAQAAAEGVTISITGAVYDGSQLAISYEAENATPDLPVIIALDSCITVGGISHELPHPEYITELRMVPSPHLDVLPAQRNPVTGGFWSGKLPTPLHGQAECTVTFIVCQPKLGYAVLIDAESMLRDATLLETDAEIADSMNTLRSFTNAVIAENSQLDAGLWSAQGYTAIDESGRLTFPLDDPRSNMIQIARITVPFTFDADKAIAHDFSGTQAEFADFTVHAASFRLTPLSTYVDMRLLPRENSESAAHALARRCGAYAMTDEHGQPVIFSDMDYCSSLLPYVTCMDGQWVCRYLIDMPGLLTFPESVGFTVQTGELLRFSLTSP